MSRKKKKRNKPYTKVTKKSSKLDFIHNISNSVEENNFDIIATKLAELPEVLDGVYRRRFSSADVKTHLKLEYQYIIQYSSDRMYRSEQDAKQTDNVLIWVGGDAFHEVYEKTIKKINDLENISVKKDILFSEKLKTPPALNVELISSVFANYIPKLTEDSGMMVGIFGSWGRGKTYLFHKILGQLKNNSNSEQEYIAVEFSAWKYKTTNSSWAYLYKTLESKYLEDNDRDKNSISQFVKKLFKVFKINKERVGLYPIIILFLSIIFWVSFSLFLSKTYLLRLLLSSVGIVMAIKISILFLRYKRPITSIYKQYFNTTDDVGKILGVQHEIQQQIGGLLKIWLSKNQKIILFIDDLDRCDIDQVLDILDGLRLILDDKSIYKHLIIIVAVDDSIIESSLKLKYKDHFHDLRNEDLYKQYLEKIFIFGIKLIPLSSNECSEIFKVMKKHHFNAVESREEINQHVPSSKSRDSKALEIESSIQATEKIATYDLSNAESKLLEEAVMNIKNPTPRKIKIFLYKYVLFIELYSKLKNNKISRDTPRKIIRKILDPKIEEEDSTMDIVSGILSGF